MDPRRVATVGFGVRLGCRQVLLSLFFLWFQGAVSGQGDPQQQEMRSRAQSAYERGDWLRALEDYERLVSLFPEEACLHGRLAGCALSEPGRLALVRRHLRIALRKGCSDVDLPYHQARLAQLEYDFERARDLYSAYLAAAGKKARFKAEAEQGAAVCAAVIWDPSEAVALKVIERVPSAPDAAFRYYNPDVPGLRLVAVPSALQSKADQKVGAGRMALHDGDTVLVFSSLGKKGTSGWDLFRVSIRSGAYTEPVRLEGAVNSGYDERDAYLSPDGLLYFTSNRPGGLGGYDIYAVSCGLDGIPTGVPRRLPYPVNSVNDDLFFIPEAEGGAWMASNRAAVQGKIHAYRVALTNDRMQTGSVAWSSDEVAGEGLKLRVFSGGELVAERDMEDGGAQHLAYAGDGSVRVVLEDADGRILAESFGEEEGAWQLQKSASGWSLEDQSDVLADWAVLADLQMEDGGGTPVAVQDEGMPTPQTGWDTWWQEQEPEQGAMGESGDEVAEAEELEPSVNGEGSAEEALAFEEAGRSAEEDMVQVEATGSVEQDAEEGASGIALAGTLDGKRSLSESEVDEWLEERPEELRSFWEMKAQEVLDLERSFLDDPSFAKAGELYDGVGEMEGVRPRMELVAEDVRDGVDTEDIEEMLDEWTHAVQSATKASLAKVAGDAALALRREKLAIRELASVDGFHIGRAKQRWSDWRDANRGVPGVSPDAGDWSRAEGDALLEELDRALTQAEDHWSRKELSGWRGDWLRRQQDQLERMTVIWEASWEGASDEDLALLESGEMKVYDPSDDLAAREEYLGESDGETQVDKGEDGSDMTRDDVTVANNGNEDAEPSVDPIVSVGAENEAQEVDGSRIVLESNGFQGGEEVADDAKSGEGPVEVDEVSPSKEQVDGVAEVESTSAEEVDVVDPEARMALSEGLERMDLLFPAWGGVPMNGGQINDVGKTVDDAALRSEWGDALATSRRVQREWEQLMEVIGPEGWVAPMDEASFRSLPEPVQEAWVEWRGTALDVLEELTDERKELANAAVDSLMAVMEDAGMDDEMRSRVMAPLISRREVLLESKPQAPSRSRLAPAEMWSRQGEELAELMNHAADWQVLGNEAGAMDWVSAADAFLTADGDIAEVKGASEPDESGSASSMEEASQADVTDAISAETGEGKDDAIAQETAVNVAAEVTSTPEGEAADASGSAPTVPSSVDEAPATAEWSAASPDDLEQVLVSSGAVSRGEVEPSLLEELSKVAADWSEWEEQLGADAWEAQWTASEWKLLTALRERIEWGASPPDAGATRSERMAWDKAVFFADRNLRRAWSGVDPSPLEIRLRTVQEDTGLVDMALKSPQEGSGVGESDLPIVRGDAGGEVRSETRVGSEAVGTSPNSTPAVATVAVSEATVAAALEGQEEAVREFGISLPAAEVVGRRSDGDAGKGLRLRPIEREALERSILGVPGRLDPAASAAVRFADERGAPIAEGVEYKVQVGAFRNALPAALFAAFDPMWAQSLSNGITRYMAGSFDAYDAAVEARDAIRALGYEDAFVVRFVDGERVVASRPEPDVLAEERRALAVAAAGASSSDDIGQSSDVADNRVTDRPLANEEIEEAADIPTWDNVEGRVYSVQVGAFRGVPDREALARLGTLTREDTGSDGWLRLFSGRFADQVSAERHRDELKADGLSDAFIVVYINGRRIPLLEASTTAIASLPREEPAPDAAQETNGDAAPLEAPDENDGADAGFLVELGVFNSTIPVRLANAILDAPLDWEVRSVRNEGLTRYRTRLTDEDTAQGWLEEARGMGFSNARIIEP